MLACLCCCNADALDAIESHVWELIETTGTKPSPRAGHSASIHGNSMVIFGGYDKDGLACNDTYKYYFGTHCKYWLVVDGCNVPIVVVVVVVGA
jgi:N-acetylneuraminic acid mutarotase